MQKQGPIKLIKVLETKHAKTRTHQTDNSIACKNKDPSNCSMHAKQGPIKLIKVSNWKQSMQKQGPIKLITEYRKQRMQKQGPIKLITYRKQSMQKQGPIKLIKSNYRKQSMQKQGPIKLITVWKQSMQKQGIKLITVLETCKPIKLITVLETKHAKTRTHQTDKSIGNKACKNKDPSN
ncbi:unnamed protein product [Mytilus edulis]|uniref:Uncharacterized protein n=1 Tax=Mytilus edulis TaxID=6550 RepID=A0A8S3SPV7_MYTED|nr:unnamed protein product [Mytilus edulis]